jgi:hypothetical protein
LLYLNYKNIKCLSNDIKLRSRLLSQAEAIGSDLTKGDSVPHLWQNLEKEWTEFNQDLRLTSGIGRIKKGKVPFF